MSAIAGDAGTLRTIATELDAGVRTDPDRARREAMQARAQTLRAIAGRIEVAPVRRQDPDTLAG